MREYNSYVQYKGDGQTTDFTVPFPYLAREHVRTTINGVGVSTTWPDGSTVRFVNETPADGSIVEIRRITPVDSRQVVYQDGARIPSAKDLNTDSTQMFFLIQEVRDGILGALFGSNPSGLDGLESDVGSIVERISEKVIESELYQDLNQTIEDIDINSESILKNTDKLANVDQLAEDLGYDQSDLAEANIRGSLREDDSLTRIRLLSKRAGDNEAAITEESTVRANEDEALATEITSVQANVDDNEAAIQTEQNARADADTAESERVFRLLAKGNTFAGAVTQASTAPTSPSVEDVWIDTSVSPPQYKEWDGANWVKRAKDSDAIYAGIQEEETARIDGDDALSSDITTVQSSVDDNTASIQTNAESIDGVKAKYTVKLDVNDRMIGFGLINDPNDDTSNGGAFVVQAEQFSVIDPSDGTLQIGWDSDISSFIVDGDLLVDGTVFANKLDIAQVDQITGDLGVMTAGTFKTTDNATGQRVEISDSGSYPMWYGSGDKTEANATFYLDTDGNAMYRGSLDVSASGSQGSTEIKENVIKVFDGNGALRVKLGDLSA